MSYSLADQELLQIAVASQNTSLKCDEVEQLILNGINTHLDLYSSLLYLISNNQGQNTVVKVMTRGPGWDQQLIFQSLPHPVIQCFETGQPIFNLQTTNEAEFDTKLTFAAGCVPRAIYCYPLLANGKKIGVLELISKNTVHPNPFDNKMVALLSQNLANAIFYYELIQQLEIANADLEANRWELLRSRNTLRALFDGIPSSIYIVNKLYDLVAINISRADRAKKLPNIMVGKRCYSILYDRSEPCSGCQVQETLLHGANTNRTYREWAKADRPVDWDIATYPIKNELNNTIQVIIFEQDITEKRRMEASLAQSEKLAAVGQLAAGVAHEINNPLSAIIANAQLLARELNLNNDELESVNLIEQAGLRASQIVRELLGFARKEQVDFAPLDVNETIRAALSILQFEILHRSVTIKVDLAEGIPPLNGNKDCLQGIWMNLVLNALDAIDNKDGKIRLTSRFDGKELRITVADNGVGIPSEKISRIFEPFYTTKDPGRGTGLGLSIIHRTVKQHGGYINVDSQVGDGTIFTVVLPYEAR